MTSLLILVAIYSVFIGLMGGGFKWRNFQAEEAGAAFAFGVVLAFLLNALVG
ncbi:MAG TPA: hypothetical protein VGA62_02140 [Acidimicrobiia bacterium]